MKIGVVIPSYNRAGFVGRTLDSVLAQTVLPHDILVVDDGSDDDTETVVAGFAQKSTARVRYLRRANGGLSAARNTGGANALPDCDALLFLDSDDLLAPTALAKLSTALAAAPDAPLAFCQARLINAADQAIVLPNTALLDEPAPALTWWNHLLTGNSLRSAGAVLLRRAALNAAGEWDESLPSNEDWDMWLRLSESGARFVRVAEPLLLYRIHGNSLSTNHAVQYDTRARVLDKHLSRFSNDPARVAAIVAGRETYLARYEQNRPVAGVAAAPVVVSNADAATVYDADARRKHFALRAVIERTGLAALYRRTPLSWRLRLRALLGISPNA